ncbi:MAG: hypothetical protein V4682_01105 [Patescibacteria group bacterium]
MRFLALSILALLALSADTARAQESIPDPFFEPGPPFLRESESVPESATLYATRFRPDPGPQLRTENGISIPFGSFRLRSEGSSSYPGGTSNLKVRNESLHLAWALEEDTDFIVGAWRFKQRQEGLEQVRMLTFGIGFVRRF